MKLYLHSGRYYEKQADCPDRKFETVEFPFAASPKADFVAWFNSINEGNAPEDVIVEDEDHATIARKTLLDIDGPLPVDQRVADAAAKPAPTPHIPRAVPKGDSVIEWLLGEATNAEVENVFTALGARFHEMRGSA